MGSSKASDRTPVVTNEQTKQSRLLAIAAWLFVLNGAWLTLRMFIGVPAAHSKGWWISAAIDLLLGLGLLARHRWALRGAGIWLVLNITLGLVALALLALLSFQSKFRLGGSESFRFIGLLGVRLAISVWQYRVLTRPRIEALFDQSSDSTRGPTR